VEYKVSGAHILLKPASAGTGLIAGGAVRTILEVAGVKNALSKSLGSSNKTNTAYATIAALQSLVPANKWVTASARTKASSKKESAPTEEKEAVKATTKKPAKAKA
jgi:small subunit ribosomal protein S5